MRSLLALALVLFPAPAPALAQFRDIARPAGLDRAPAGRTQLIDVDGDGWLDLVCGGQRILRNVPGWFAGRAFRDVTAQSGLGPHAFFIWADLDGDGRLDAVGVASQNAKQHAADPQTHQLYRGTGGGRFRLLRESGLARRGHRTTHAATIADLDLDGRLDLAFGNSYEHYGKSLVAQPLRVYQGKTGGAFRDVTEAWGLPQRGAPGDPGAARPLFGLVAADLDGDGWPELVGAAYGRQPNVLWRRGPAAPRYAEIAREAGIDGDTVRHGRYPEWTQELFKKRFGQPRATEPPFRSHGNTFALVPGDFDGDGDLDLFSAEITHAWAGEASDLSALLVNQLAPSGKLVFARQIERLAAPDPRTGLVWRPARGLHRDHAPQQPRRWNQGDLQAHWADLDNDGRLDLLVCESDYPHNRLRVWLQQPDRTFRAAERALGLVWPNCPGLALGDVDRDGDLDLVASGTRTRWPAARPAQALALFENRCDTRERGFLCLKLQGDGRTANRDAIGAAVTLVTDEGTQTRVVLGPYGHWAAQTQPGELHFGLGRATPRKLVVVWPDRARTRTELGSLPRNAWVVVRQGAAEPVVLRRFDASRWR